MDVHYPVREGIEQYRGNNAHETGKNHQIDLVLRQGFHQGGIILRPTGEFPIVEMDCRYAVVSGALQSEGVSSVADDADNFRLKIACCATVDYRLQVGAAAGDKNAESCFGYGHKK